VIACGEGPRCLAAEAVALEIARHLPRLAERRELDLAALFAALQIMPIDWQPASAYEHRRREAEELIGARDPDDWPTLAVALAFGLPVWTQDKDHAGLGIQVYTTGDLLDALRDAGQVE